MEQIVKALKELGCPAGLARHAERMGVDLPLWEALLRSEGIIGASILAATTMGRSNDPAFMADFTTGYRAGFATAIAKTTPDVHKDSILLATAMTLDDLIGRNEEP